MRIPAIPGFFDIFTAAAIARKARVLNAIVHAHGLSAGAIAAIAHRFRRFPLIVTLHNMPPGNVAAAIAIRTITARADRIITVSRAIAARIPGPCVVIPNGIDLSRFSRDNRDAARLYFGVGEGEFAVGCVARLSREKGVDILIQAALMLPDIRFLIAGDGPERAKLGVSAPKNVSLLGRIGDVTGLYYASDVVAVPSRSEGQGIAALEAMAAGRPVVASKVGGLPETIEDGKSGLLVRAGSPQALADAIDRLRDDPGLRASLSAAARQTALALGDIRKMIEATETVYGEM